MYAAFETGDRGAIARSVTSPRDYAAIRADALEAAALWTRPNEWRRVRALFMLDFALMASSRQFDADRVIFLSAGREIVTHRTDLPGVNASDDQFEIAYHRVALGILAGWLVPDATMEYLTAIDRRMVSAPPQNGVPRLVDPRLLLIRAIAQESRPTAAVFSPFERRETAIVVGPRDTHSRRELEQAVPLFEAAEADPASRAEAIVRGAFVLFRLGRNDAALAKLDGLDPGRTPDPFVDYFASLFRGRVLEALKRPIDAGAAYERALAIAPGAQSPAVALAVLHLRSGQPEAAMRWAASARSTSPDADDPWWRYAFGDQRLINTVAARLWETPR